MEGIILDKPQAPKEMIRHKQTSIPNPSDIITSPTHAPGSLLPPCYSDGMASQSKSDAARANGAKSKGPTTPEGKGRSSKNALKHGLTAQFETLPGESQEDFDALLDSHQAHYQPASVLEHELVRTLAITRWRLRRIPTLESNVLDNEMILREEEIDEDFSEIDDSGRLGFVFRKLADHSQALSLLIRYEAALTRVHDRVFRHLTALQKLRNEPNVPPAGPVGQAHALAPPPPAPTPQSPDPSPTEPPCVSMRTMSIPSITVGVPLERRTSRCRLTARPNQLPVGVFSTDSITRTSMGALRDSSFRPSWSWKKMKIEGPCSIPSRVCFNSLSLEASFREKS
jgi:hypothetical protein